MTTDGMIHETRALNRLKKSSLAAAVLHRMGWDGAMVRAMTVEERTVVVTAGVTLSDEGWEWAAVIVDHLRDADAYWASKEQGTGKPLTVVKGGRK